MSLTIAGRVLAASLDTRTITGLLLPYGETGNTNVGRITAAAGSVTIPADASAVVLNIEHDGTRPVGRGRSFVETERGLEATFHVAATRAGDDVLEEAAEGLRSALSVEVDQPVIRAGALIGGNLTGAAVVVAPAFPSAQLVAADVGELPDWLADQDSETESVETIVVDGVEYVRKTTSTYKTETTPKTDAAQAPEEEATMPKPVNASAPVRLGSLTPNTPPAPPRMGLTQLAAAISGARNDRTMLAALADIVPANITTMDVPEYIGELWSGVGYQRLITPLFNQGTLTALKTKGWKWATKPKVGRWAGNKTDVPSAAVATEPVEFTAQRLAGAWDIDRAVFDFNDTEFIQAFLEATAESYAYESDDYVFDTMYAAATAVERGDEPAGVAPGFVSLVDGALYIIDKLRTLPTFALMNPADWRTMMLTRQEDRMAYFDVSLNLAGGSVPGLVNPIPYAAVPAGETIVGVKSAATVKELPGSPIRVDALDIAKGGVDQGVFGYLSYQLHNADGVVKVVDLV